MKPKIYTKDDLLKHEKETDLKSQFAKKVALSNLKKEALLPDKQYKELQNRILERRLKEKEMRKELKKVKR